MPQLRLRSAAGRVLCASSSVALRTTNPICRRVMELFTCSPSARLYGSSAPCGPGTVLKVGKVGAGNRRRFTHSHYNPSAPTISTLAQSLLAQPVLWPWLGIDHIDAESVEEWMLDNLDRIHFFMPGDHAEVHAALEVYVRARVGSVFEGVSIGAKRKSARTR